MRDREWATRSPLRNSIVKSRRKRRWEEWREMCGLKEGVPPGRAVPDVSWWGPNKKDVGDKGRGL